MKNALNEIGTCLYLTQNLGSFIWGHYILEAYLSVCVYNMLSTHICIYCCSVIIYLHLLHVTLICNEYHIWCNVYMESEKYGCMCVCVCVCVGSKTEVPISLQWKKHPQHLNQPCPWPACPSLQTLADFFLCPELVTYRCLLLLLGF